jgi:trehalose 6-phosphate synthase/phosphatase
MSRLIVVANRLPVSVTKRVGELQFRDSPGGLATGLASLPEATNRLWIGWPGIVTERLTPEDKSQIKQRLEAKNCIAVPLSRKEVDSYYLGFCNKTVWPLFHYFPVRTVFEQRFWESYRQVNEKFCDEVVRVAKPGDSVWVHDFQLMLLPELLRERIPDLQIGFFLHIPWPSFELFRLLPWREEILNGILGADLIGFHSYDYVRHFLSSVCRITGLEQTLARLTVGNRLVKVDAFPMGIDYSKYAEAINDPEVQKEVDRISAKIGERKIIMSVDRLDYTKGITQRLEAFDLFLSENPEYKGQVTLIIVAVPSRTGIEDYRQLRNSLEHLVGRVDGEHGAIGYMPVWYLYRFLPFKELAALYNIADVALVTPLRDGMNLVAKEFVATKADGPGVLILGEMTGAASELGEALIINANDKRAIIRAIKEALEMPKSEQTERNKSMQERLRRYDVTRWASDFLNALSEVKKTQEELAVRMLSPAARKGVISRYKQAQRRLLLLDYDGTLVGFRGKPEQAGPDQEVIDLLQTLSTEPENTVVVVSGRDRATLGEWLGHLEVDLAAEHGGWVKRCKQEWEALEPLATDWKGTIRPILELYSDRTPGSLVEEKDFSLVWHYRRADPELAYVRTHELRDAVVSLTENLDVGVFEGSKILEIRKHGVNKGRAAELWLHTENWDFVLVAGDDYTDEEMFGAFSDEAYSIKVGPGMSKARFSVDTVEDMRSLLRELTEKQHAKPR